MPASPAFFTISPQTRDFDRDEARQLVGRRRLHRHKPEPDELAPHLRVGDDRTHLAVQPARRCSAGVPAGATSMNQDDASNSFTPISASGGTSGMASMRSAVVTPSMRSLPACASGTANGDRAEHERDVAAGDVVDRRLHALVGHVRHRHAERRREHHAAEMLRGAGAGRAVAQAAGRRLRELREVGERMHRQRGVDHQHLGHARDQRDRREILRRIVGQALVQTDVGRRARWCWRSSACSRRAARGSPTARRRSSLRPAGSRR